MAVTQHSKAAFIIHKVCQMTDVERSEICRQLEANYLAEAKRLARTERHLERLAINATLAGDFSLEAVANEALRISDRSR